MDLKSLVGNDFTRLTAKNLAAYKRRWSKILGKTPKNSQILSAYKKLVKDGVIKSDAATEKLLQIKKVRSISGVTPMAVMTKPFYCPGKCTYCPLEPGMPKSYLPDEPAAQRAKLVNFNPFKQIKNRLDQLQQIGHHTDKLELIVIGGTFSAYPDDYKIEFFKRMFDACNGVTSKTLKKAQKLNETAKHRIVGISIETRPDWIDENEIKLLRKFGVTKVQLGVQAFDATILKKIKRGHSLLPVAEATKLLRNSGFKICYHLMPNLPGSNPKKDIEMAKIMYKDRRFKPDFVKIYPTQVIPNTELHEQWKAGKYKPYGENDLKKVLTKIKLITPPWVRIDRLVRDISRTWVVDGTLRTNMRQIIQEEFKKVGKKCKCIRCREIKHRPYDKIPRLLRRGIDTLGGKEIFLSFESKGHLYSLIRLRLVNKNQRPLFSELDNAAIVRELHTFGAQVPVSKRLKQKTQHQGLGKSLLSKAEKIAKKTGYKKIAVISAIGTRNYYRKLGFHLEGLYMVKNL